MFLILIHDRLKIAERILETSLITSNAAQLKMRVRLRRVDRHRVLEIAGQPPWTACAAGKSGPADTEPRIVRIDSGRFQVATVTLPLRRPAPKLPNDPRRK